LKNINDIEKRHSDTSQRLQAFDTAISLKKWATLIHPPHFRFKRGKTAALIVVSKPPHRLSSCR
jgi:hypothetical protein